MVMLNSGTALSAAQGCASIPTLQDLALEGDHDFIVSIDSVTPNNAVTIGAQSMHTVTITDNDGK